MEQLYTFNAESMSYEPAPESVPAGTELFVFRDGRPVNITAESPVEETPTPPEEPAKVALLDAEGGSRLVRVRRGSGEDTQIVAGRVFVRDDDGALVFEAVSTGEEG